MRKTAPAWQHSNDYEINTEIAEPTLFILQQCDSEGIKLLGGMHISKKDVSLIIVVNEILVLIFIILAYNMILYMAIDFSNVYDSQTVEARDFTCLIQQLPLNFRQYHTTLDMKAALWNEIQESITIAKKLGLVS